jgi:hypothetical protein
VGSNLDQRVARHVDDALPSLEALFAAAEAVEALQASPGWTLVTRILDMEIAEIDRDLDRGNEPLSQAQYAKAHGRRGGLRGAHAAMDAIVQKAAAAYEQQARRHEQRTAEPALERS